MRNLIFGVLLGILVAVPIAYTQQQRPESIEIGGVLLHIGMPQDSVISKIAESGLTVTHVNYSTNWVVSQKNDKNEFDALGMLAFTDSRLTWASRSWGDSADSGAAKLARSFYFLLKSFEDAGNTSCTISTHTQEAPDLDQKSTDIRCGKRAVAFYVVAYKDQRPTATLDETIK
jgi:hypothetical protein